MEGLGSDSDWKSTAFRQRVVTQIEKEMKKAGTAHTKSSTDMENHVYIKAKTREEYLSWVARLIIHFRDIHKMTQGQSAGCAGQMQQFIQMQPPLQTTAMQQNMQFQHMNQQLQHPNQQHQAQTTGPQMMSSPSPVQVQTPQPASQPPTSQHSSLSYGPTPSAGGFQPSSSPQPSQSPASSQTPQSCPLQVPSPGPLNTPGNPSSVMSPAGASQSEDQLYMDKVKKLSKYIEPLRRLINKIEKNEDRKKVVSKMKTLLNILTDPNTRCSLKTLEKCEKALEKLKNDIPVQDAVMANVLFPVLNHSPTNTFAPAMTAIHGPPITSSVISTRKRKLEDDDRQMIPKIIQGEVALLDSMFHVNLDPSYCSNNGTVYLICKLDDDNISSVPPLQLSIPADYPDQSPHWEDDGQQYEANIFLQTVHKNMTSKLLQLPDKHSVTALLNTWAQSVRQACLSAA